MTSLRFSSLIRFTDNLCEISQARKANPEFPKAGSPYLISNRTQSMLGGFTEGALDCNVANFSNGKEALLYHLIPIDELEKWPNIPIGLLPIQCTLTHDLDRLSKDNQPVTGLITGGYNFDRPRKNCGSLNSERLLKKGFEAVLASFPKIQPSIIWGRRHLAFNHPLSMIYTLASDTAHIWAGDHISTLKNLQQTFSKIRIAPGDTLELPDSTRIEGLAELSAVNKLA